MADRFSGMTEKRSEPRSITDKYYSVELSVSGTIFVHQFKIWDMSSHGLCILVKEDSDLLKHLEVGTVLEMKYYGPDSSKPFEFRKTQIRHITKHEEGKFKGHCSVGILISEDHDSQESPR